MPLQTSGQISFSNIATEVALAPSQLSLRTMSSDAGLISPDNMSDFYGVSITAPTYNASTEISYYSKDQTINAAYEMININGRVIYNSTLPITERGIVYSTTTSTPTIGNGTQIVLANHDGYQNFSYPAYYGKYIYVRTYATNRKGTTYGLGFFNATAAYHSLSWSSYWGYSNYGTVVTNSIAYGGCDQFSEILTGTATPTTAGTGFDGFNITCLINGVSFPASISGNTLSFQANIYNHPIYECTQFSYQFKIVHSVSGDSAGANYVSFGAEQYTILVDCDNGQCP
jgi:hypothetical protein